MAKPAPPTPPVDDDLDLKPAQAGVLFRAEMFTSNVVLGYWRTVVAVIVAVLLVVLLYGQYRSWYRRTQRAATAQVAEQLAALPESLLELEGKMASGETVDTTTFGPTADALTGIAATARGTSRSEALLMAAELSRMAGAPDKQREALTLAAESASGILAFAAEEALANLDLAEGRGEEAVARLRTLAEGEGFLAEQATLDLGLALEHLGRHAEANEVYAGFLTRWPDSPRKEQAEERQAKIAAMQAGAG